MIPNLPDDESISMIRNDRREMLGIIFDNSPSPSPSCRSTSRDTRSLSGTYSTIVNFNVSDFLRRAEKLPVLQRIKCYGETNTTDRLFFPIHHKHKQKDDLTTYQNINDIDQLNIEHVIFNAYEAAKELVENLKISRLLKEHNTRELNDLSRYIYNDLKSTSRMNDNSTFDSSSESESDSENYSSSEVDNSDSISRTSYDDDNEDELFTTKKEFSGIRLFDSINQGLKDSYFKIELNNVVKYMRKQTACWFLTEKNSHLPSDRLKKVMETNRQR